ncbi:hypothetical protein NTE_03393 [Candidatus Nitrososphaera evergladensis SR1]|uniref:Uncharacterized protein n=1 Tax=Candidatus Nitrososphaera evergladensis SR1 TaxID=1459636 RepID=A0A075MUT1_9ARCH|nr:hypothetical protein [Candidatus Nitrososphaera evergladensis]AIF85421.1 hypothetical protein NTE_03393 [Candidatus Nitrososphaera evergladensis SR1]
MKGGYRHGNYFLHRVNVVNGSVVGKLPEVPAMRKAYLKYYAHAKTVRELEAHVFWRFELAAAGVLESMMP